MNGTRAIFRRKGYWLTALAAAVLLAASPGTALAQDDPPTVKIDSVTLSPTTVPEGGEATATVKFTVTAGTGDPGEDDDNGDEGADVGVTVGFAWDVTGLTTNPRATNPAADGSTFSGLTATEADSTEFVSVAAIRGGSKRQYTATRTFRVNHDLDAEGGQFKLGAMVSGWSDAVTAEMAATTATFKIADDEDQKYTLSLPSANRGAIKEGAPASLLTLTADPKRSRRNDRARVHGGGGPLDRATRSTLDSALTNAGAGSPAVGPLELAAGNPGASAMVPLGTISAKVDKNRVEDTVTVKLYIGSIGSASVLTDLAIPVVDIHKLAAPDHITAVAKDAALGGATATEIVEGGDPVYLTITVDRGSAPTKDLTTAERLTVNIRSSGAQGVDFEVEPTRVTLDPKEGGKSTSDVDIKLWAVDTDDDVGAEDLVLHLDVSGETAKGPGTSTGMFSIAIVDETMKKVAPASQADAYPKIMAALGKDPTNTVMNPGDTGTVMTSDLFTVMDGYTAAYGASVEGSGVSVSASGDSITVDAKSATGAEPAKVTVTATAKMTASSFAPSQTVSNIAEITFPVTVVDMPLVVTLAADPTEIDEGGTSMITATANRYVTAGDGAVEINLVVVPSDGGTLDAESIMIAAGAMSGSAMLTVTADDDMDNETVTVVATGSGIDASRQVAVAVTDTTEAVVPEPVPALPLIAQWLLGLGLLGGGARQLFRRRLSGLVEPFVPESPGG